MINNPSREVPYCRFRKEAITSDDEDVFEVEFQKYICLIQSHMKLLWKAWHTKLCAGLTKKLAEVTLLVSLGLFLQAMVFLLLQSSYLLNTVIAGSFWLLNLE